MKTLRTSGEICASCSEEYSLLEEYNLLHEVMIKYREENKELKRRWKQLKATFGDVTVSSGGVLGEYDKTLEEVMNGIEEVE